MSEPNPMGLGHEAEEAAVAVEAPWPADLYDFEPGLVVTVEQLVPELPLGVLERDL